MAELTLFVEDSWTSPWVFHAIVALEEKGLAYDLEVLPHRIPDERKPDLRARGVMAKVPMLVHGAFAFTESSAISEYLAETYPAPAHPRLFPADLRDRARARQVMSMLRTSTFALREERPTSSLFGAKVTKDLSPPARADADELVRIAEQVIGAPTSMFAAWCIADADLGLALMRLVGNDDAVPTRLADYARAQWLRPSARAFLERAKAAAGAQR
jgi:glutathione S-transferase